MFKIKKTYFVFCSLGLFFCCSFILISSATIFTQPISNNKTTETTINQSEGGGRFAAIDYKIPPRGDNYFVTIGIGENFPITIPRLENRYRWEELGESINCYFVSNGNDFLWSKNIYHILDEFYNIRSGLSIQAISVEGDNIWAGVNGVGLVCLDKKSEKVTFEAKAGKSLRFDIITSIATSPEFVWIGTPIGLEVYNKKENFWVDFDYVEKLKGLNITHIAMGADCLWIATKDCEILKFNLVDKVYSPFKWEEGKKPNRIKKFIVDGKNLWIASDNGVWKYLDENKTLHLFFDKKLIDYSGLCIDKENLWVENGGDLYQISKINGDCRQIEVNSLLYFKPSGFLIYSMSLDDKYIYIHSNAEVTRGLKDKIQPK